MPASVGPISLPNEFEIAVIDTAPGGYGLKRTTGPFYAQPGDVWEVEIPVDDGSAPDMFYRNPLFLYLCDNLVDGLNKKVMN